MTSSPAPAPALHIEGLEKSFGSLAVLRGIDLDVAEHEVVCLIGASGSGKSTLLRCINLIEPIDAGRIVIEGQEITSLDVDVDRIRRRIGIVFQAYNLFPHMSVLDNITLAPRKVLRHAPPRRRGRRDPPARAVRARRQAVRLPRSAVRRTAATRRDHPRAGDAARPADARRGDQRPGPGARRRGAGRDPGARRRGHDDADRDPRDGVCPGDRRSRVLPRRRRHRRGRSPGPGLQRSPASRGHGSSSNGSSTPAGSDVRTATAPAGRRGPARPPAPAAGSSPP